MGYKINEDDLLKSNKVDLNEEVVSILETASKKVQMFFERYTGIPLKHEKNLIDNLKCGVVLCHFANRIWSNSIPNFNYNSNKLNKKNLKLFLKTCKNNIVPRIKIFKLTDFEEPVGKNLNTETYISYKLKKLVNVLNGSVRLIQYAQNRENECSENINTISIQPNNYENDKSEMTLATSITQIESDKTENELSFAVENLQYQYLEIALLHNVEDQSQYLNMVTHNSHNNAAALDRVLMPSPYAADGRGYCEDTLTEKCLNLSATVKYRICSRSSISSDYTEAAVRFQCIDTTPAPLTFTSSRTDVINKTLLNLNRQNNNLVEPNSPMSELSKNRQLLRRNYHTKSVMRPIDFRLNSLYKSKRTRFSNSEDDDSDDNKLQLKYLSPSKNTSNSYVIDKCNDRTNDKIDTTSSKYSPVSCFDSDKIYLQNMNVNVNNRLISDSHFYQRMVHPHPMQMMTSECSGGPTCSCCNYLPPVSSNNPPYPHNSTQSRPLPHQQQQQGHCNYQHMHQSSTNTINIGVPQPPQIVQASPNSAFQPHIYRAINQHHPGGYTNNQGPNMPMPTNPPVHQYSHNTYKQNSYDQLLPHQKQQQFYSQSSFVDSSSVNLNLPISSLSQNKEPSFTETSSANILLPQSASKNQSSDNRHDEVDSEEDNACNDNSEASLISASSTITSSSNDVADLVQLNDENDEDESHNSHLHREICSPQSSGECYSNQSFCSALSPPPLLPPVTATSSNLTRGQYLSDESKRINKETSFASSQYSNVNSTTPLHVARQHQRYPAPSSISDNFIAAPIVAPSNNIHRNHHIPPIMQLPRYCGAYIKNKTPMNSTTTTHTNSNTVATNKSIPECCLVVSNTMDLNSCHINKDIAERRAKGGDGLRSNARYSHYSTNKSLAVVGTTAEPGVATPVSLFGADPHKFIDHTNTTINTTATVGTVNNSTDAFKPTASSNNSQYLTHLKRHSCCNPQLFKLNKLKLNVKVGRPILTKLSDYLLRTDIEIIVRRQRDIF